MEQNEFIEIDKTPRSHFQLYEPFFRANLQSCVSKLALKKTQSHNHACSKDEESQK